MYLPLIFLLKEIKVTEFWLCGLGNPEAVSVLSLRLPLQGDPGCDHCPPAPHQGYTALRARRRGRREAPLLCLGLSLTWLEKTGF